MKLEPIIDLVEKSGATSVHYSRRTAIMTRNERERLQEVLNGDRLIFFDGTKMATFETLSREFQLKLEYNDLEFKHSDLIVFLAVYEFLKMVIDSDFEPGGILKHTVLIFENADQILCDDHKEEACLSLSCDEFLHELEKAGNYAARSFADRGIRRRPVGFNAYLLFDPKVKRPNIGNARHIKL